MTIKQIKGAKRPSITFKQLRTFVYHAHGKEGMQLADAWLEFNERFWQGELEPTPIFQPSSTAYGRWVGLTTFDKKRVYSIQIKLGKLSLAEKRQILVHEMVHQHLVETGVNPRHNSAGWCSEIMRISRELGREFWASPPKMARVERLNKETGRMEKTITRINPPGPNGEPSLSQQDIAHWPQSVGIQP